MKRLPKSVTERTRGSAAGTRIRFQSDPSMAMDARQLRYFVAVAEDLHFGHAAERLHVSQPSLSRQIGQLERQLGVPLLDRNNRKVELTRAGSAMLEEARQILGMTQRAARIVRSVGNKPAGVLRIGTTEPLSWLINGVLLRQMAIRHPSVRPSLENMPSSEQKSALRYRQLDVGLVWELAGEVDLSGDFDRLVLFEDGACLVMAPNNRLAQKSRVTPADLATQQFLIYRRRENPTIYDAIIKALRSLGVKSDPIVGDGMSLLGMVRAGLGVSFANICAAPLLDHLVVVRPINEPVLRVRAALVWRRGDVRPALRALIDVAREIRDSGYWSEPWSNLFSARKAASSASPLLRRAGRRPAFDSEPPA